MNAPLPFYKDPDGYRKCVDQNPDAIVVSESDSKKEHEDTMHKASCHHASGNRMTEGDWSKQVFLGCTRQQVEQYYQNRSKTVRACSVCF